MTISASFKIKIELKELNKIYYRAKSNDYAFVIAELGRKYIYVLYSDYDDLIKNRIKESEILIEDKQWIHDNFIKQPEFNLDETI